MSGATSELVLFVNGKKVIERQPKPEWTLLYYLRSKLHLTGTKLGCGEGGCGACTVMISKYDRINHKILHFSAVACLVPLCAMHGLAVTTVEGIGSTRTKLHPVQERLAKYHGSQCGFCTPGFVMSMYALLRNNPQPSLNEIENAFHGNLCRCTGYRPILDGFKTFSQEYQCPMGNDCCQVKPSSHEARKEEIRIDNNLCCTQDLTPYDYTQEIIFPNELQLNVCLDETPLEFQSEKITWFRPTRLEKLLALKSKYPDARLVVGNTAIDIKKKFKNKHSPEIIIAATHIEELAKVEPRDDGICFGGSVTLTHLEKVLGEAITSLPEHQTRTFVAVNEMLRWFGSKQIRNVASIAGNIMTASRTSDLNPLWLAAGCMLTVCSKDRESRQIRMDSQFFIAHHQTSLEPDEVLVDITIPFTRQDEYFYGYKQAQRRDVDMSIVNAGMRVIFETNSNIIMEISLVFGGMPPVTIMARKTMEHLVEKRWDDNMLSAACHYLKEDLQLSPGASGGAESYRCTLTTSFFFKFYLNVLNQLNSRGVISKSVPSDALCMVGEHKRDTTQGTQAYQEVAVGQGSWDPVGRPIVHVSAIKQATGEDKYGDDMTPYENELYLALVTSSKAHAEIMEIDASDALKIPGVVDFIFHKDVPGSNKTGPVVHDEEVFASNMVTCQGQIIGAILAENKLIAKEAARAINIQYKELDAIITIEEAIAARSYFHPSHVFSPVFSFGDINQGFAASQHTLEGEVRLGGQEQFYLETQACIAVPQGEDGYIDILSSTQNPTLSQLLIASALGVPANRITVKTKRIGGSFGGKDARSNLLSIPVAVAANKHLRPVRSMLDRNEDMVITGTRHPYLARYKVGFSGTGVVHALKLDLYSNCGNSLDYSAAIMDHSFFHMDNAYKIPHIRAEGHLCQTNIPSNSACRGFGCTQTIFICEYWMTAIANYLGIEQEQVRELNMYKDGDSTHFNQILDNCNIRRCWDEVKAKSYYEDRKKDVAIYNRENRWSKRGIAICPLKQGVAFDPAFINQSGALVHIYTDGSVLLTHGGIENGQGLHTKMIQVASRVLCIAHEKIYINETSTDKVPNTTTTAGSVGSDLNGMAVLDACQSLMSRLKPYIDANPKGSWEDWVTGAYMDRISLSAVGYYRTPDLNYNRKTNRGRLFAYFTYGAAVTEVEIDCLTGDHTVLRTDIVMDVGTSLNPAIDIGQIEGGFMHGYGLFTLEEQKYSPRGYLHTQGPATYKIPAFSDIPVVFNVSLLKGSSNPRAVYSSKGVGEPPVHLAASVFFAIKAAIASARQDAGHQGDFHLNSPATSERIRMSCADKFTEQFPEPVPGTYIPWSVCL